MHLLSWILLAPAASWPVEVESALSKAGENRPELAKALEQVSATRREGLEFLIANMPERDLRSVKADFLLEHVDGAYDVLREVPWGAAIPRELFLDCVLPYASLTERRERWRRELAERCLPLVKGCRTTSEGAQALNENAFPLFKVRYSTQRKKADQGPLETMESGLASCTGLSILLVGACRSVGIPARVAGTPCWTNGRGNHTWVEVWDGDWHFLGAAEPDRNGLDRAWFAHDASLAVEGSERHAIYAASFRRTARHFPLVWEPEARYVSAVDVTARYARKAKAPAPRVLVRVLDREGGRRASVLVEVADLGDAARVLRGSSRAETADENDILAFEIAAGGRYEVRVGEGERVQRREHRPAGPGDEVLTFHLEAAAAAGAAAASPLADAERRALSNVLARLLRAPRDERPAIAIDKVFLMGYSHGGYGAFAIGPKMPDLFAAVHSSAAAPTDGETSPVNLRNTVFTFMIGENDRAYGRIGRCQAFHEAIARLRGGKSDIYPVAMEHVPGHGHGGLPDRDKVKDMYPAVRNPIPRELSWELTDRVVEDFFWLRVPEPGRGQRIEASLEGNELRVTAAGVRALTVFLDGRLADLRRPVAVHHDGRIRELRLRPSLRVLCESLLRRGDIDLAFTARVDLPEERQF